MPYDKSTPLGLKKSRESSRKWYEKNKAHVIAANKKNSVKYLKESKEWVRLYKSEHPCKCGETHVACILFHHLDPSIKTDTIANGIKNRWSITKLQKEINKCETMCSNCHLKLHWNERNMKEIQTNNLT